MIQEQGTGAIDRLAREYPELGVTTYDEAFDHESALASANVVIVHEWTSPDLIDRIGRMRRRGATFTLLFHDTHHRAVSASCDVSSLRLENYDAILAFGEALRERYVRAGWGRRVYTWHEAADTTRFRPPSNAIPPDEKADIVWIGNWGDEERAREMLSFLVEPARKLGLGGTVHGVRYPPRALRSIERTKLKYRGYLANYDVPLAFSRHRATLHIPRRPYVEALPGIPTIRVFEALACKMPLICAPWRDTEGLFRPGQDYLIAHSSDTMSRHLQAIRRDPDLAEALGSSGLETVLARHTCRHRVDELLGILAELSESLPSEQRISFSETPSHTHAPSKEAVQ